MTYKDFEKKIGKENANKLNKLRVFAANGHLKVVVRKYPCACGDFCIFIYDKRVKPSYMVGFDGDFDTSTGCTIGKCIDQSFSWIKDYMKSDVSH